MFTLAMMTEVHSVYLILTVLTSSYITCSISLFYRYKYMLVMFTLAMTTEHLFVLQKFLCIVRLLMLMKVTRWPGAGWMSRFFAVNT